MIRPEKVRDGHKHHTALHEDLLKIRAHNKDVCAGKKEGALQDYGKLKFDIASAGKTFKAQAEEMLERGTKEWLLSSQASNAEHHAGTPEEVFNWTQAANNFNSLVCRAYPNNSQMICWLPQASV